MIKCTFRRLRFLEKYSRINCRFCSSKKLLKSFYKAVHPDVFQSCPEKQRTNEESLKILNAYIDDISTQRPHYRISLTFHMHKRVTGADSHSEVNINLSSKLSKKQVIDDILKQCGLTVAVKPDNFEKDSERGWGDTLKDMMEGSDTLEYANVMGDLRYGNFNLYSDLKLSDWLESNMREIHEKKYNISPLRKESIQMLDRLKRKYGIVNLGQSNTTYSVSLVNAALKQLERLLDRDFGKRYQSISGKTLKFDKFNGLDQTGRIILNVSGIPSDWKRAFMLLPFLSKSLDKLKEYEKGLTKEYFGIRMIRNRASYSYPIQAYARGLSQMYEVARKDRFHSTSRYGGLGAVISWYDDFLSITREGYLLLNPYVSKQIVHSYCSGKENEMRQIRKDYLKNLDIENRALDQLRATLQLFSLEKDNALKSDQVQEACNNLQTFDKKYLFKDMAVILSQYYSVSTDGVIRIPWDFSD